MYFPSTRSARHPGIQASRHCSGQTEEFASDIVLTRHHRSPPFFVVDMSSVTGSASAPHLAHPDYAEEFSLYTDASIEGLGAVLAQNDDEEKEHSIVYLSRSLTPAEKNYTITELECLAIVWSSRSCILTSMASSSPTLQTTRFSGGLSTSRVRTEDWSGGLWDYNRSVHPMLHVTPFPSQLSPPGTDTPFMKSMADAYEQCTTFKPIVGELRKDTPGRHVDKFYLTAQGWLIYVPANGSAARLGGPSATKPVNFRTHFISEHCDIVSAGHLGTEKTLHLLSRDCFWYGMAKDVKDRVRSCYKCQTNKSSDKPYGLD